VNIAALPYISFFGVFLVIAEISGIIRRPARGIWKQHRVGLIYPW
jgi:hypothetical protein